MSDAARDTKKGLGIFAIKRVVTGSTAGANLSVAGIAPGDAILSVIGYDGDNVTPADSVKDFTSEFTVSGVGTISAASQDTSGYQLVVEFAQANARDKELDTVTPVAASDTLSATQTTQLTTTAVYDDGSSSDVTEFASYSSDDENVATVDSLGVVTAVATGTATITATFQGVQGTEVITVS